MKNKRWTIRQVTNPWKYLQYMGLTYRVPINNPPPKKNDGWFTLNEKDSYVAGDGKGNWRYHPIETPTQYINHNKWDKAAEEYIQEWYKELKRGEDEE